MAQGASPHRGSERLSRSENRNHSQNVPRGTICVSQFVGFFGSIVPRGTVFGTMGLGGVAATHSEPLLGIVIIPKMFHVEQLFRGSGSHLVPAKGWKDFPVFGNRNHSQNVPRGTISMNWCVGSGLWGCSTWNNLCGLVCSVWAWNCSTWNNLFEVVSSRWGADVPRGTIAWRNQLFLPHQVLERFPLFWEC